MASAMEKVSAARDSALKVWGTAKENPVRTMKVLSCVSGLLLVLGGITGMINIFNPLKGVLSIYNM